VLQSYLEGVCFVLPMVHALSTTCRLSVSFMCVAACRYLVPLEGPDGPYLCGGATQASFLALFYSLCLVHQVFSTVYFPFRIYIFENVDLCKCMLQENDDVFGREPDLEWVIPPFQD
jgi:hypothetical protein